VEPTKAEKDALAQEKAHYHALALQLRSLTQADGWDTYRRLLEDAENGWIQRLLGESRDQHDYNRGVIQGLREAFHLPQQVIARADKL
jgi:hypothetical protein